MRVFHILSGIENGGVEMLILRWRQHLPRDVEFHVVAHDVSSPDCARRLADAGVVLHTVPCRKRYFSHKRALLRLFSAHRPNVVHVHTSEWGFLPLRVAKKAGVPVRIQHSHAANPARNFLSRLLFFFTFRLARKAATAYLACGKDAAKTAFGEAAVKAGCVKIIPNGIDTAAFAFDAARRAAWRESLGYGEDTLLVGMVARFSPQKNHAAALQIFREFYRENQNSVLLLAGTGKTLPEIQAEAARLLPQGAVRFLGVVEDVAGLLSALDAFILPSHFEGLPITLIEAQTAGLLSVVSDTVTREAAFTPLVRFLPTRDAAAFAAEIKKTPTAARGGYAEVARAAGYDLASAAKTLLALYRGSEKID